MPADSLAREGFVQRLRAVAATAIIAALAIGAIACNDDEKDSASTPTTSAGEVGGPQTLTVQVDGDGDGFDAVMFGYFPDEVTAHAGDTLRFKLEDTGEPHTVSAGDPLQAIADFITDFCGPEGFDAPKCAEDAEIPPDIEEQFNTLSEAFPSMLPEGPGDANQGPANPCFLETGEMALDTACPKVSQPDFNGKQAFYSSGWMGGSEDFVMTLADDIAPGTYTFMCLLHGPEMIETITVVDDAADADTSDEVDARREEQLSARQQVLAQPAADLKSFAGSDESGVHIDVQVGAEADAPAFVAEFGPEEITVPVGGSVSWGVLGGHTISFNAGEDVSTLRTVAADGTIHLNEAALALAQVPEPPAEEEEQPPTEGEEGAPPEEEGAPPEEEGPPPVLDAGSWNGEGFLSTGFADGVFTLTFSTAGTYEYKCLIHPGMEGTVKVE